jgi:hypothetical protein
VKAEEVELLHRSVVLGPLPAQKPREAEDEHFGVAGSPISATTHIETTNHPLIGHAASDILHVTFGFKLCCPSSRGFELALFALSVLQSIHYGV